MAGVQVEGLASLVRRLQALGLAVDDLKDAFSTIAGEAAEAVSRHAPRKSGRLAADVRGNRAKAKAVVRAGRAAVPYAGPVNYGWPARHIAPAMFMQRGEAEYMPRAVGRLEDEIDTQIRKRGLDL
ncbi:MAG: hypothetical protein QM621_14865 [Aeromicrobium sp.]|uniref:hypothetical protein n=1 Tax=Aeromicrobium sp. TaxID=1871063 RepID=UPI0039E4399E